METKERVDALVACERTKFTDEHRDWLGTLSDDQLVLLEAETPEPAPTADPPVDPPVDPPAGDAEGAGTKPPDAKIVPAEDGDAAPAGNKAVTVDEYVAQAPPEVRSVLLRAVQVDNSRKDELVQALLGNARNQFTEAKLREKEIGELEALAELAREPSFAGAQGGPGVHKESSDNPMPKTLDC